eukprot:Skav228936  [mRNA]  locus=scaffold2181:300727:301353:+ [translate_table: standard]
MCFAASDDLTQNLRGEASPTEVAEPVASTESGDSKPAEDASAVNLESLGTQSSSEASVQGATCEKWVSCKDGFFGNIHCSGSRYCVVWGRPRRHYLRGEASPAEVAEPVVSTESGDSKPAEDASAVNLESLGTQSSSEASVQGATCEKWVSCKDGFFGNIHCNGSRYCEIWGPVTPPHGASCKKWVTCKDGFFGNIRCTGSRHCEAWR